MAALAGYADRTGKVHLQELAHLADKGMEVSSSTEVDLPTLWLNYASDF